MMKKILKSIIASIIILFALATPAHAEWWAKGADGGLYTNGGNGLANSPIHVSACYIGTGTGTPCSGGGGGGGTVTQFNFTNGSGFTGTVTNATTTPTLALTTSLTQNSIPFIGASGALTENTDRLVWNTTATGLDIGTKWPIAAQALQVSPFKYNTGTASQNTTTNILGVGTSWTADYVGNIFIFADGTTRAITGFVDATNLTVASSATVASQAYEIHYPGLMVSNNGSMTFGSPTGSSSPNTQVSIIKNGSILANTNGLLVQNLSTGLSNGPKKVAGQFTSVGPNVGGSSSSNIGVYVSAVSGGFANYDAVFNGGADNGILIGSAADLTSKLSVTASGAKTISWAGETINATGTSSTASINKTGLAIASTGTWNGTTARNVGLNISAVTGGTVNYGATIAAPVGIQNTAPTESLSLGTAGTTQGTLGLYGSTSGNVVVQSAPATSVWSLTLPTNPGTNNFVLTTNGSGTTAWTDSGSLPSASQRISALLAANATNDIDNTNYKQLWRWETLNNDIGLGLESSSTVSTGSGSLLFDVGMTGANAASSVTTTASRISNAHSGTSSTNVALQLGSTNATNNYALIVPSGNGSVGIGTSTPAYLLDVTQNLAGVFAASITNSSSTGAGLGIVTGASGTQTLFQALSNGTPKFEVRADGAVAFNNAYGTSGQVLQSTGSTTSPIWTSSPTVSVPISSLLAATATNSIDNTTFGQTWSWTGKTGTGLHLTSNSTAETAAASLLTVDKGGTNATSGLTTYGGRFINQNAGTTSTNIGIEAYAANGTTNNIALWATAGRVKIGAGAPTELLDVNGNFRLDGAFMPGNNAGTAGQYLVSTGTGTAPVWSDKAPGIVATGDSNGQSTNQTVASYTTPNDGVYRIYHVSASLEVTAVGGAGVVTEVVEYTDKNSVAQTATFVSQGLTVGGISSISDANFPVMGEIAVAPNTTINVKTKITIGTATYDAGATIFYIRTPAL